MHRTLHVRADERYERGARSSEHGARSSELGAGVHREGEALDSQASIEPKEVAPPPYVCLCAEGVATGDL